MELLSAKRLVKSFGKQAAVKDVSFAVNQGDIYGFLGPNGSGKSTSIRMILGLIRPDSGSIELFGEDIKTRNHSGLKKIGALIERPDFYDYLTAYQNLAILMRYSGLVENRSRIMEVLAMVDLAERAESRVKSFSQGMKQRLGIAQTLIHNPELIILDEPVNGLDPQGIRDMRELILRLNQLEGKTLIISSHILREMELIANRMVVINKGEVVVEGNVKELLSKGTQGLVLICNKPRQALELLRFKMPQLNLELTQFGEIQGLVENSELAEINRLLIYEGINVTRLATQNSLEDYFLTITE